MGDAGGPSDLRRFAVSFGEEILKLGTYTSSIDDEFAR
jgi:hypothetical protein